VPCLPRPPSHEGRGRGTRSLGCGGVSLNTMRPGVALAPGSGSHLPWAVPPHLLGGAYSVDKDNQT
jgi:hypothetical protein